MIKSLEQLSEKLRSSGSRYRVAVAWAQDVNTLGAVNRALQEGIIEALLIGDPESIKKACEQLKIDSDEFTVIESPNEADSAVRAVEMVRSGKADILMKGLVGTDVFLRAVLDRNKGLLLPDAVLSYVCAVDIPSYDKLLFLTDTAVLPFPDLHQKKAMANYSVAMAKKFGIKKPKLALIGASEKLSKHFPSSSEYPELKKMVGSGDIEDCIMDGPLDLFLACDPEAGKIKGIDSPINGEADILLFPSLESCNPFYKGLMQFAGGELAGMLTGTSHPVVLMSRSESEKSKYYCIALACLMAE